MVTEVRLHQPDLEISLVCRDAVDFHENIYLKEITVGNLASRPREARLFFHLDLGIAGNDLGDTAGFDPKTGAVFHYKGPRYFLLSGLGPDGIGLSQYAVGQKGIADKEGTFRDAEDGRLSGNLIAQGSVDSVVCVSLKLEAQSYATAFFWIAAGLSW
jgi:GH15 family glucan-1,4-alpha-glucosidase